MENTYGIGVANRYALFLDDESDPLEALKLKEQEKELKKKTKVAEKENKGKTEQPPKGKTPIAPKKTIKENTINKPQDNKRDDTKQNHQRSNADGKPERNFNKFNNENREERNNRRNREDRPYNGPTENRDRDREDRPPRRENNGENNFENRNRGGRPVGNKPGGPKAPRRPFDDRRGKREFDRQSGSDKTHGYRGVKPIDKREGAGAHNWGSHKDVIEEADKPNTDADQSWGDVEKTEAPVPEQKEENEAEPAPVEEEPKELTLDEWKAQRAGRLKPQYNIRKAGEGEDPSQWKKMYELRKKENAENAGLQESDDEDYDVSEYPQRVGRQKHVLDIDIQFNDARRGGGGRGRGQRSGPRGNRSNARGGGGGGGGGGPPGDRPEGGRRFREEQVNGDDRTESRRAPKVDDERDFPSLG